MPIVEQLLGGSEDGRVWLRYNDANGNISGLRVDAASSGYALVDGSRYDIPAGQYSVNVSARARTTEIDFDGNDDGRLVLLTPSYEIHFTTPEAEAQRA